MYEHQWNPADLDTSFAWVPHAHLWVEPIRAVGAAQRFDTCWDTLRDFYDPAVVQLDPDFTAVHVMLHHPDDGEIPARVALADLRGRWDAQPPSSLVEATGWDPGRTWEEIARERYAWVQAQRDLADRLTKLGVPRRRRHYAGRGGTSMNFKHEFEFDALFTFGHEELDRLVALAESGNT
jgi:hypothetical protein